MIKKHINEKAAEICEYLLQGNTICSASKNGWYVELISDDSSMLFDRVEDTLSRLNRRLCSTDNKEVFFCTYKKLDIGGPEQKEVIEYLKTCHGKINDVARFVRLIFQLNRASVDQLLPGAIVKESWLIESLADDSSLWNQFKVTAAQFCKGVTQEQLDIKSAVSGTLKRLEKDGYFIKSSENNYTATGKWAIFFEIMEFLAEREPEIKARLADESGEQSASVHQPELFAFSLSNDHEMDAG